jgi:hypothetical protein
MLSFCQVVKASTYLFRVRGYSTFVVMGRSKFSEAGPKRSRNTKAGHATLAAKSGFDGLTEAPWRKTPSIFKQPVTLVRTSSSNKKIPEAILVIHELTISNLFQKKYNAIQRSRDRLEKPKQVGLLEVDQTSVFRSSGPNVLKEVCVQ